ncbi:hypothetical protein OAA91_01365 [Fibrobacterales bacterium]|nr:hypothetical protein [Fibrobacterales bacterium]
MNPLLTLLLGTSLLLTACNTTSSENRPSKQITSTSRQSVLEDPLLLSNKQDSINRAWHLDEWQKSPVWICHPDWNHITEDNLLNFELTTDSTARFRNMRDDISDKQVAWSYEEGVLSFKWNLSQSKPEQEPYELTVLAAHSPLEYGFEDVYVLEVGGGLGFEWECRAWVSFD